MKRSYLIAFAVVCLTITATACSEESTSPQANTLDVTTTSDTVTTSTPTSTVAPSTSLSPAKKNDLLAIDYAFNNVTDDARRSICAITTDADWTSLLGQFSDAIKSLTRTEIIAAFKDQCAKQPSVATTTTVQVTMDAATVAWWLADEDLHGTACAVGYDIVKTTPGLTIDKSTFQRLCAGETPQLASRSGIEYSIDELRTLLEPPAIAWMTTPSGPAFDALAATARSVIDSGRPLPALMGTTSQELVAKVMNLFTYPGSDQLMVGRVDALRELMPGIPAVYGNGTYRVGTDIQPGRFRAGPVSDCYWETLDAAGNINDNNFVTDAIQIIATVRRGDFSVRFDGCGLFVKVS